MPQLNPAPWFVILLFSWMVFLIIMAPKIYNHKFPNEPSLTTSKKPETSHWIWPWS
uniref:ATP synthase complex subunit 8 n=2 Tax=Pelodytes TaxID=43541 RepID=S4V1S4_9ANUR|nr:ATP synthase F0 subunit 8 [Pelodytes cf. punctatus II-2011]AEC33166.1 ATP synthase F0 subunit 8 [Pelodytes cf. punctatus II-2011]AGN71397.1 ATP synthase F0 subunit 8 [Pelodytes ibericus]